MRLSLRARRRMAVVAWVLGAAVTLVWSHRMRSEVTCTGVGWAVDREVAALEPATVLAVPVVLHQVVEPDQVVARLDPGPLRKALEVAEAELLATQEEVSAAALSEARRFAQGLEERLLDRARLLVALAEGEARLGGILERLDDARRLAERGAGAPLEARDLEREAEALRARLDAQRRALEVADRTARQARERQANAPDGNRWATVAAARRVEAIQQRIAALDLRAGMEGQVEEIYRRPGDVVTTGEPVVRISRRLTREIVAWAPLDHLPDLAPGRPARVRRATGEVLSGAVVSVGAGPSRKPAVLWSNPTAPEWGVPIRIRLDAGGVAPREPVGVAL